MKSFPTHMQAVIAREPGPASVLSLVERPVPEPGAGEVLLRVAAAGINRPDIMQRQGLAKVPAGVTDVLGLEVCGEVVACGPGVPADFLGRRLMSLVPGGGYAPWCVASLEHSFPVPAGLDSEAAAAMPEGLFTVWHNLFELGRLQMGETVLIHGGSGGIGTLAIRMARAAGAIVVATVGQRERIEPLEQMGVSKVICFKDTDFVEELPCVHRSPGRGRRSRRGRRRLRSPQPGGAGVWRPARLALLHARLLDHGGAPHADAKAGEPALIDDAPAAFP